MIYPSYNRHFHDITKAFRIQEGVLCSGFGVFFKIRSQLVDCNKTTIAEQKSNENVPV